MLLQARTSEWNLKLDHSGVIRQAHAEPEWSCYCGNRRRSVPVVEREMIIINVQILYIGNPGSHRTMAETNLAFSDIIRLIRDQRRQKSTISKGKPTSDSQLSCPPIASRRLRNTGIRSSSMLGDARLSVLHRERR